jgi:hypothetical protein
VRTATLIGGMAATVALAAAAVAQPTYEAIPLPAGTFLGAFGTGVRAVSSDGRTVAGDADLSGGDRGWRWRSGIGRFDYGPPAFPFFDIEVTGLSGDGSTVVGLASATGGNTAFRSRNDGAFELYTVPAGDTGLFRARTDNTGSSLVATTFRRAFAGQPETNRVARFSTPTSFEVIPAPSTADQSFNVFTDMSGNAQRIVSLSRDTSRGNARFAAVWREGQGASWLPVTPNTVESVALTTSREGDFTAGAVIDATGQNQLARWQGDELLTFDLPAGRRSIDVFSISNDGSIITGTLFGNGAELGDVGFVWTAQTGVVDAKDYLLGMGVPFSTNPSVIVREVARVFVSADGNTICGLVDLMNTQTNQASLEYFRAVIPTPAPLIAGALGAVFTLRRRRHTA